MKGNSINLTGCMSEWNLRHLCLIYSALVGWSYPTNQKSQVELLLPSQPPFVFQYIPWQGLSKLKVASRWGAAMG